MQAVLRVWFLATALGLVGAFIWVYMPIVVPILLLTLVLGVLVAAIVWAARRLERARCGPR